MTHRPATEHSISELDNILAQYVRKERLPALYDEMISAEMFQESPDIVESLQKMRTRAQRRAVARQQSIWHPPWVAIKEE